MKATRLAVIILGSLVLSSAGAVEIVVGPYLQNPAETSMTVMWITDEPCTSWVEYGTGDALDRKAYRSRHGLIDAGRTVHRVEVAPLTPGTAYRYRVCSKEIVQFEPYKVTYGQTAASDVHAFTTLESDKDRVSFIVLNDIHQRNDLLASLVNRVEPETYEFVFFNGDVLGHIENERQIVEHVLAPCTNLFASRKPLLYVRGNHETRGRFARMLCDYLALPGGRYYYAFDHGPVHFVVMDSGEDKPDEHPVYAGIVDFDRYREAQCEWFERQMQSEAFRTAPFRVVLVHIPPKHREDRYALMELYKKWRPLFNRGKVDLVISGHTHRYEVQEPAAGVRNYLQIIGGSPKEGQATVVRVEADADRLDAVMTRDDGEVVATCSIKRK